MKKVFLIHGLGGTPNGGWRSYVMEELRKREIYACSLPMPTPDNPVFQEWIQTLAHQVESNKHDELYLVGHSLGVSTILRYLEIAPKDIFINGIVLVAGPIHPTGKSDLDQLVFEFIERYPDFNAIRARIGKATIIHAVNDPAVTPDNAEIIAEGLKGKLILLPTGGHLNSDSGCNTLPEVIKSLEEMFQ